MEVISSTHPIHRVHGWFARRYRPRRMAELFRRFTVTTRTRVLDVGGSLDIWLYAPLLPRLTLLNIYSQRNELPASVAWVKGDARDIPFGPGDFDLVFSNSVIEHVGEWQEQRAFANEVLRMRTPYWIQTPNYRFPIEPHLLGFGVQWLPRGLAAPYAQFFSARGIISRFSREAVLDVLDHTRLLSPESLRALFPDALIWEELTFGLTKSIVAYGPPGSVSAAQ